MPYTKSGGSIEDLQNANIERNRNIIGWDSGNAELGAILSRTISEDYEMMRTIQNVVQHMELHGDIPNQPEPSSDSPPFRTLISPRGPQMSNTVDFENKEFVTAMEFSERVNLQVSDITRVEKKVL